MEWIDVVIAIGVGITIIKIALVLTHEDDDGGEPEPEHQPIGGPIAVGSQPSFDDWWARTCTAEAGREQGPVCGAGWL